MKKTATLIAALLLSLSLLSCENEDKGGVPEKILNSDYIILAWSELGMYDMNDSYDDGVLHPPYASLRAQVIRRGDPPSVVTSGLTVEYNIINNTYSYAKGGYGRFWENALQLFGVDLYKDEGLNFVDPDVHNRLDGKMLVKGTRFEADGIPLTPLDDHGRWNPYQTALVSARDSGGRLLADTFAVVPVSDEVGCYKCHGQEEYLDILLDHDSNEPTSLASLRPVLCAECHGSLLMGKDGRGSSGKYLSEAIHGTHAFAGAACYDCHPGASTKMNRSLYHTFSTDGGCRLCHGTMDELSSSVQNGQRTPWRDEPSCTLCHTGVSGVDTGSTLYKDATGHGGVHCSACHGTQHALVPSEVQEDNSQARIYQESALTIGSCAVCHGNSRGGGSGGFNSKHGGSNPNTYTACNVCHTAVSASDTSKWPHSYEWQGR